MHTCILHCDSSGCMCAGPTTQSHVCYIMNCVAVSQCSSWPHASRNTQKHCGVNCGSLNQRGSMQNVRGASRVMGLLQLVAEIAVIIACVLHCHTDAYLKMMYRVLTSTHYYMQCFLQALTRVFLNFLLTTVLHCPPSKINIQSCL